MVKQQGHSIKCHKTRWKWSRPKAQVLPSAFSRQEHCTDTTGATGTFLVLAPCLGNIRHLWQGAALMWEQTYVGGRLRARTATEEAWSHYITINIPAIPGITQPNLLKQTLWDALCCCDRCQSQDEDYLSSKAALIFIRSWGTLNPNMRRDPKGPIVTNSDP